MDKILNKNRQIFCENFTTKCKPYQRVPHTFPSKQTTSTEFCSAWVWWCDKSHVGQAPPPPPSLQHHNITPPHTDKQVFTATVRKF